MSFRSLQLLCRPGCSPLFSVPPPRYRPTHRSAGPNLEIFKFGLYIMFPIAWMYYFGTNLDSRFSVPDFWPKPEETNRIPFEREEQKELAEKMREARLARKERRRRKELEERRARGEVVDEGGLLGLEAQPVVEVEKAGREGERMAIRGGVGKERDEGRTRGLNPRFGRGAIEKWARGE